MADKFRIERILAEGGMSLVVAATHIQLEQTVALKFFRGDLRTSGEPLLRFMREAKAAAQIKSEYVARVLDVGVTDDGTPYMVMEYLEGHGLEKVIAAEGPLDVSSAVEYAIQACEGLAEAHARGIIHRDIKPSNLFLSERSPGWRVIKVLDFGISKVSLAQASNITTKLNLVMGTPCYMSPEQLQSAASVDQRTDIWSLGATLFEMLSGRPPFDPAQPLLAIAEQIINQTPPKLHELRPEVPRELSDVVARCMAKNREHRIPSAASLAIALLPFAPGRAGVTAERAAAITPTRGLEEMEPRAATKEGTKEGTKEPTEEARPDLQWTQIGFASPTPPARENPLAAAPATPAATASTVPINPADPAERSPPPMVASGDSVDVDVDTDLADYARPRTEPGSAPPWQPKTSAVVITAGLLVCAVAVLAVLRATPAPRAPVSAITVVPAQPAAPPPAPSAPAVPGSSELTVRVTPPSAQIMIDGAMVAGNPFRGRFPGGIHQVQAFAAGYEPKIQQASLATDVVVELSLERRSKPLPPPRGAPSATQARMPPPGQNGRLQPSRLLTPARLGGAAGAPGLVPAVVNNADIVDPRGGRSPMHPIETRSPYKNP